MRIKAIFCLLCSLLLSGCGILSGEGAQQNVAIGAISGTLLGGGIGAAIGSAISDGDIGKSAALGAGIGLAVGMAGGYAYKHIKTEMQISDNEDSIEENRLEILAEQQRLETLRQNIFPDASEFILDPSRTEKVYDGATLGVYYR